MNEFRRSYGKHQGRIFRRPCFEAFEDRRLLAMSWTGGASDSLFGTAGNWSAGVPGPNDSVEIEINASIQLDSHKTIEDFAIRDNTTSLDLDGSVLDITDDLVVAGSLFGTAKLDIVDGSGGPLLGTIYANDIAVGDEGLGYGGHLSLTNGTLRTQNLTAFSLDTKIDVKSEKLWVHDTFVVGDGAGTPATAASTLSISDGGRADANDGLTVGMDGGNGIIDVDGATHGLLTDDTIVLGKDGGKGEMSIKNGATVKTYGAKLGDTVKNGIRPKGIVSVEAGATWEIASPALTPNYDGAKLEVGLEGEGLVNIAGLVETGDTIVGVSSETPDSSTLDGTGEIKLSGAGKLDVHGSLTIGKAALGNLFASGSSILHFRTHSPECVHLST